MSRGHLSSRERYAIEQLLLYGCSKREIGRRLCRHHSVICREVDRNGALEMGVYVGEWADHRALERRRRARHHRRWHHGRLRAYVFSGLRADWSPEQISGRLTLEHPGDGGMRIAPETVYQWVYRERAGGGALYTHLRRGHKRRRRQRRYGSGRGRIAGRVGIRARPAVVGTRRRFGDWEGDLVEGGKGMGVLVTLLERRSRYLLGERLASKHAGPTAVAIVSLLAALPPRWRRTLTLDNGKEFAAFKDIEAGSGIAVYFADPYAAWQRGANENANGLIRQYLPKGMDMRALSKPQLAKTLERINNRPRKCLGYKTPSEVLRRKIGGAFGY